MLNPSLLRLLQLTDPTLPNGGFYHTAGLETYVQLGLVRNASDAGEFIRGMLTRNIRYTDAAFVSLAFEAAREKNAEALLRLDEECTSVKLPRETRQASEKLGIRLLKLFRDLQPDDLARQYQQAIQARQARGHYCLVFGVYACALGIAKAEALTGFYYNAAVGMVTNSVKLIPLGQQDGQQLLFGLQPLIRDLVDHTLDPDPDLIGLCCPGFDIRCMQHEQLYSRLYMS
jgi:urease accessory protein